MARLGAGVRKRSDGMLEKRFTIDKKRISVYGRTTKEIQEKEKEILKQIEDGLYFTNRNITLDNYFEVWIKEKRSYNKSNSIRSYCLTYENHIKSYLGKSKVQDIKKIDILELRDRVIKNHSVATANYVITVIKMILRSAVSDEIVSKNVCVGIRPLTNTEIEARDSNHRALTNEEQTAFLDAFKDNYYYEFVEMLLLTGMRAGELSALSWKDIDYKKNVIHIRSTITRSERGDFIKGNTPKSKAGVRNIPLNDDIREVLHRQKKKMELQTVCDIEQNVFLTPFGKYITSKVINQHIKNTIDKMEKNGYKMDRITAHAFRDTFATRYIENGGNPKTLMALLGHTSYKMTMDLYTHVLDDTMQEEMNRIKII